MSKREVRAAMCDGKARFPGYEAALRTVRHKGTHVYRCRFCRQWLGQSPDLWPSWVRDAKNTTHTVEVDHLKRIYIPTLEGLMTGQLQDWIIRGVKGEIYPCKPDIFAETYEAIE